MARASGLMRVKRAVIHPHAVDTGLQQSSLPGNLGASPAPAHPVPEFLASWEPCGLDKMASPDAALTPMLKV